MTISLNKGKHNDIGSLSSLSEKIPFYVPSASKNTITRCCFLSQTVHNKKRQVFAHFVMWGQNFEHMLPSESEKKKMLKLFPVTHRCTGGKFSYFGSLSHLDHLDHSENEIPRFATLRFRLRGLFKPLWGCFVQTLRYFLAKKGRCGLIKPDFMPQLQRGIFLRNTLGVDPLLVLGLPATDSAAKSGPMRVTVSSSLS